MRLSSVLENLLYFEMDKQCPNCKQVLREEEIMSGFEKNLTNYKVVCPICKESFIEQFTIYTE